MKFFRETAVLTSALTLATAGCGDKPKDRDGKPADLSPSTKLHEGKQLNPDLHYFLVRNISDHEISISSDPVSSSLQTEVGRVRPGVSILAFCIDYNAEYPKGSKVGVVTRDYKGQYVSDGYIGVYEAGNKAREGQSQLDNSPVTLYRHLPDCPD